MIHNQNTGKRNYNGYIQSEYIVRKLISSSISATTWHLIFCVNDQVEKCVNVIGS